MYIVVLVTVSSMQEAQEISAVLVEEKLAACVNIIKGVQSLFWWEGKVDRANEILLVIKSKKAKLAAVVKRVKSRHSYTTPEIIALPLIGGDKAYLKWIDDSIRKSR